ncbi:helix-turn-helix transcriptional regulator [Novosphingobium sp. 9]|uniref:S24 family peptidase n=1 Tax=Novosphingobium sp. 9 TaxID=2025349 RepID=UPI0021B547FE|nr:S24 family peptidase [Novosphingobium sp. 9]
MDIDKARSRLLELASEQGVSLSALSQMLGRNASYLQQFVRKGSPRKLEEHDRGRLARFFGVDEAELRSSKDKSSVRAVSSATWVDMPRLAVGASAGAGALVDEEAAVGILRFSGRWLREMGLRSDRLSVIVVDGDSMEPTLRNGDELLVDTSPGRPGDGIWVVRLGDTVLVKRLEIVRPGVITLLSDNQAYRPVECLAGDVAIIGRVVWKGGRL